MPGAKVTSYSWLVTRISPFAKASGDKPHPPSRGVRHPPPEAVGIGVFPVWVKPYCYGLRASAGRNILCVPAYNRVLIPSRVHISLTFCVLYATFWPRPHGGCLHYCVRGAARAQSMRYQPILLTLFPPFVFL